MTASPQFVDLLQDLLSGLGPVSVKRMFGGAGIYVDGLMFGLVIGDVLYLKADEATKSEFEAEGLGPFVYDGKAKPVTVNYWRVPERLYDDAAEMTAWARVALAVARRAAAANDAPTPQRAARAGRRR